MSTNDTDDDAGSGSKVKGLLVYLGTAIAGAIASVIVENADSIKSTLMDVLPSFLDPLVNPVVGGLVALLAVFVGKKAVNAQVKKTVDIQGIYK